MEKVAELDEFEQGIDKFCEDEELDQELASQLKNAILTDVANLTKTAMSKSAAGGYPSGGQQQAEESEVSTGDTPVGGTGNSPDEGIPAESALKQVLGVLRGGAQQALDTPGVMGGAAGLSAAGLAKLLGYNPGIGGALGAGAVGAGADVGIRNREAILRALLGDSATDSDLANAKYGVNSPSAIAGPVPGADPYMQEAALRNLLGSIGSLPKNVMSEMQARQGANQGADEAFSSSPVDQGQLQAALQE